MSTVARLLLEDRALAAAGVASIVVAGGKIYSYDMTHSVS